MRFVKMHGLSNDFVVVDETMDPRTVTQICDRRKGVGADGVLSVTRHDGVIVMGYWNADGSEAEMCGNGLRCVARYAHDRLDAGTDFTVETPVGPRRVVVAEDVKVELGRVELGGESAAAGRTLMLASVGNPHAVVFVDDPDHVDVSSEGPAIASDTQFPHGTNVEFVVVDDDLIRLRVWERGVGETPACGSGMVAAATVARSLGMVGDSVPVKVAGGVGVVSFDSDGVAWLTGPAVYVFEGEFPLSAPA